MEESAERGSFLPAAVAPAGVPLLGPVPGRELLSLCANLRSWERELSPLGAQLVGSDVMKTALIVTAGILVVLTVAALLTVAVYQGVSSP
jgi:hypothetical protein